MEPPVPEPECASWLVVLFCAVLSTLSTGIGALPLLVWRRSAASRGAGTKAREACVVTRGGARRTSESPVVWRHRGGATGGAEASAETPVAPLSAAPWLSMVGNAVAAGLMLAASWVMYDEGVVYGPWIMWASLGVGAVFVLGSQYLLETEDALERVAGIHSSLDARRMVLIMAIFTLHSFAEGIGVGVSFGGSISLGWYMAITIAFHNIPEGLAIALVLVPRGVGPWHAALWGIVSSVPQTVMAVPAYLFVDVFREFLPAGLGFASGAMVVVAVSELIPDALNSLRVLSSPSSPGATPPGAAPPGAAPPGALATAVMLACMAGPLFVSVSLHHAISTSHC